MPLLLKTVLEKIPNINNETNRQLITNFHKYLIARDTSESHQKHNIKIIIKFADYLKEENNNITFFQVKEKELIVRFLDKSRKTKEEDPEQKWVTTWNDYLWRVKYFFRWLYCGHQRGNEENIEDWETPEFARIKSKKTKRLSPYSEAEIWDRDELLTAVKYEPYLRNKATLTLFWDLNARPHEITLLRIKNIRLREKYGYCSCKTLEMKDVSKALTVNETKGLIKMAVDPKRNNTIVGVHILADLAADMIHEAVFAVKYKLTVYDIIDTVHVFPTMTEAIKLVATAFKQDVSKLSCCAE